MAGCEDGLNAQFILKCRIFIGLAVMPVFLRKPYQLNR
ncbi:hypothetical protein D2M30_3608 [Bacillus amyloliquefaciens]|nr:hypothetical protein D2M30_3608 [Bacillus amyloliquefaciens]